MASAAGKHPEFILTLSCEDRPGVVYAVSSFLVQRHCTIISSQQYGDQETGLFFMRVRFACFDGDELGSLQTDFARISATFDTAFTLRGSLERQRVLLMVSKFGHCLNDLLFRVRIGAIPIEVVGVVSNHRDYEDLVEDYDIPFHYLPVTPETKGDAEKRLLSIIDDESVDLVVLARYMQVLSEDLCRALTGRAINIHHSFLPSFKGGRPYHQAHERGVKLIGATAHYVTTDLDEGPIIEQEVARVDHSLSAEKLVAAGRDVECQALARAVLWHAENRILLNGPRTVVFR
ncbi:MAG: formyltetrahydrofolate deformylase [Actinomycetia bacterium]|nr:formyltetrahydrofolate deformylase [Actinomycetes bacterium]